MPKNADDGSAVGSLENMLKFLTGVLRSCKLFESITNAPNCQQIIKEHTKFKSRESCRECRYFRRLPSFEIGPWEWRFLLICLSSYIATVFQPISEKWNAAKINHKTRLKKKKLAEKDILRNLTEYTRHSGGGSQKEKKLQSGSYSYH